MSDSVETPVGLLPAEWDTAQLRDAVDPSRHVTYGIVQPGEFDQNGVLLIRGQDYIKGWSVPDEFFRVARPLHNSYKRSTTLAGDVLMCIVGATTGAVNVVPEWVHEANITQTTARISCNEAVANSAFVSFVLASEIGQFQVRKYVKGSAQPGLNLADVERFFVPLPAVPEQRKIAWILTTLDELIEKTEALIAKYQAVKQGMMHDLFTRGVDEHGHLRPTYDEAPELYKESELGWIPKEWEVKRITESCSEVFLGLTSKVDYVPEGGVPLIRATDIAGGVLSFDDALCISLRQHKELTKYRKARRGDVLVSKSGSLGVCALVDTDTEFSIYESIIVLQPTVVDIESNYLLWLMRHHDTQRRLLGETVGSTVGHLNLNDFKRLTIPIPTIEEQRKIGIDLNALEHRIRFLGTESGKLLTLKTGLMQDLLTGKVRVKPDEGDGDV